MATKKYLDSIGLSYLWNKITMHFITPKASGASGRTHDLSINALVISSDGKRTVESLSYGTLTPGNVYQYLQSGGNGQKPVWVSADTTIDSGKTNSSIPTTKAVFDFVSDKLIGALIYRGVATLSTFPPSDYKKGDLYIVGEAGTYAGQHCEIGDYLIANKDKSGAGSNSDWDAINGENQVEVPSEATSGDTFDSTLAAPGGGVTIAIVDGVEIPVRTPANWAVSDTMYELNATRTSESLATIKLHEFNSSNKSINPDAIDNTLVNLQFSGESIGKLSTQFYSISGATTARTVTIMTEDLEDHNNTTYTFPTSSDANNRDRLTITATTQTLTAFTGNNRWKVDTAVTNLDIKITDKGHYAPTTVDTANTKNASATSVYNLSEYDGDTGHTTTTGYTNTLNVITGIKLDRRNHVIDVISQTITSDILALSSSEIDAATDGIPNSELLTA